MLQIDAGGDLFVTTVGRGPERRQNETRAQRYSALCMNRLAAMGYRTTGSPMSTFLMGRNFKYTSCGPHVCWVINYSDEVFITKVGGG